MTADEGRLTSDDGRGVAPFKFEKLEVWQRSLEYVDLAYEIAGRLPRSEEYNSVVCLSSFVVVGRERFV